MRKIKEILSDLGFYDIPDSVKEPLTESFDLWKGLINFDEALNFYGLWDNSYFMELFKPALNLFYKNPEMQYAVYFLNEYLFDTKKYNWERNFNRDEQDMFAAIVLLSGYKKHIVNMQQKKFDKTQIALHKHRIYECCTIGFDTYGLSYMQTSQLKWGTIFINAHIYEIGRLQFEIGKYEYKIENFSLKDKFCVEIHIPRGGRLDICKVDEAISNARKVLPKMYKELPSKPKFFLFSWLLSKEVEKLLPSNSNIKSFYQRFKIIEDCHSCSLNHFLFDKYDWDIENFPENTSLRSIVKRKLLDGEQFHDGIGILK